jgi:hypothetical protein
MVSWAMETARKITVEVAHDLLDRAQRVTGAGIAQTVRTGLQLVAASHALRAAATTPGPGSLLMHAG